MSTMSVPFDDCEDRYVWDTNETMIGKTNGKNRKEIEVPIIIFGSDFNLNLNGPNRATSELHELRCVMRC
jgi:hypothetical protein